MAYGRVSWFVVLANLLNMRPRPRHMTYAPLYVITPSMCRIVISNPEHFGILVYLSFAAVGCAALIVCGSHPSPIYDHIIGGRVAKAEWGERKGGEALPFLASIPLSGKLSAQDVLV